MEHTFKLFPLLHLDRICTFSTGWCLCFVFVHFPSDKNIIAVGSILSYPLGSRRLSPKWQGMYSCQVFFLFSARFLVLFSFTFLSLEANASTRTLCISGKQYIFFSNIGSSQTRNNKSAQPCSPGGLVTWYTWQTSWNQHPISSLKGYNYFGICSIENTISSMWV